MNKYHYSDNNKCKDCGKLIQNNSKKCRHCSQKGKYKNPKNHPNFKTGFTLEKHYCIDCKKDNLITTCNPCNTRANYNRNYWQEYYIGKILTKVK